MSLESVIAIATGIVVSLAGAVGFLFRAYTQAKDAAVLAKDETISLARGALLESSLAHREAATALIRHAEAAMQQSTSISALVLTMNTAAAQSSKEHAAVISELRKQRAVEAAEAKRARQRS